MKFLNSRARYLVFLIIATAAIHADEGMWLPNEFPRQSVAASYGFEVTDAFLDNLRSASARFNNGGSGSFVSSTGLLFTNHHVGADCIQKLSSPKQDYMGGGFYARTQADERTCPDLEINALVGIRDVTEEIKRARAPGATAAEANHQKKAAMGRIEQECAGKSGNRCDVVSLYSGGKYHLYEYKKFTDVRLVFAPEFQIAAFGGDPDNFTYPRYCLDFALFRAYENGKPAASPKYLRWSSEGVQDGQLTFVPGNPGTTGRLATLAELQFLRDYSYPFLHKRLDSLIAALKSYSSHSVENRRVAQDNLWSQQNSYKAYSGFLAGLRDPGLMRRKEHEELALKAAVEKDPGSRDTFGKVWGQVEEAYSEYRMFYKEYLVLERLAARGSDLLRIARDVVRLAEERAKPSDQRLREYTDSALPSLEQELFSTAPVNDSMETAVLTEYFSFLQRELKGHPVVDKILDGRTPESAASDCVRESGLKDIKERKRLAQSAEAVRASKDGMIRLARVLDEYARPVRKLYEDKVEAVVSAGQAKIAQARFAAFGAGVYPDATFTLRLTYGPVKGYKNESGKLIPYATDFAGLYERATGKEPYQLPRRWVNARNSVNLKTPFNFVTTADTHGGNSGSPTVNTKGEIVGILFDGNIEGLPNRFVYTEDQARSVHVASQAIIEALREVYSAKRILAELGM